MTNPTENGNDGRGTTHAPFSSARLRLEVTILATDQPAPAAVPTTADGQAPEVVLIVASDADVRHYIRECLRDRSDVRALEAPTSARARELAVVETPHLVIVAEPEATVLEFLTGSAVILIADNVGPHAKPSQRLRLLAPPFTAQGLLREVSQSLAWLAGQRRGLGLDL